MAKKSQTSKKGNNAKKQNGNDAWISMRTGLIVITVVSIGMAGVTAFTIVPALGWMEGLLWSVGFAGAIWLVFIGFLYFNKFIRKKRD